MRPRPSGLLDPFVAIRRCLEDAQSKAAHEKGKVRQSDESRLVEAALDQLQAIRAAYREGLAENLHSVRVSQMMADFDGLIVMLQSHDLGGQAGERLVSLQNRIGGWQYESRRWVRDLPLHRCVTRLPANGGASGTKRAAEMKALWRSAGGAWFGPPPHRRHEVRAGVPAQFGLLVQDYPASWVMEPMDLLAEHGPEGGESPSLPFEPEALVKLLEFAKELLMLEVGGPDRGGNTTFVQRRRGASLKDAFALSCLLVFEGAVGPRSARQRQFYGTSAPSTFEHFVNLVHEWAVGPGVPKSWALGPDPIRNAIATRMAWLKLFKVAGCLDAESFNTLPAEAQEAAVRKLRAQERRRLVPAASPLV